MGHKLTRELQIGNILLDRFVIMNQETCNPPPYYHIYLQISFQFAFTVLHLVNRVYELQQFYPQKLFDLFAHGSSSG